MPKFYKICILKKIDYLNLLEPTQKFTWNMPVIKIYIYRM